MTDYKLYEYLKEAYETSTKKHNRFKEAIMEVNWDKIFKADGEIYFVKKDFILTVESLNPFQERWKPSVLFSDGSLIEF